MSWNSFLQVNHSRRGLRGCMMKLRWRRCVNVTSGVQKLRDVGVSWNWHGQGQDVHQRQ